MEFINTKYLYKFVAFIRHHKYACTTATRATEVSRATAAITCQERGLSGPVHVPERERAAVFEYLPPRGVRFSRVKIPYKGHIRSSARQTSTSHGSRYKGYTP